MNNLYEALEPYLGKLTECRGGQLLLMNVENGPVYSEAEYRRLFQKWAGTDTDAYSFMARLQPGALVRRLKSEAVQEAETEAGRKSICSSIKIVKKAEDREVTGASPFTISYSVHESRFGRVVVTSSRKGICSIDFQKLDETPEDIISQKFRDINVRQDATSAHESAVRVINGNYDEINSLSLHLNGTDFQIKVWRELMKIPPGGMVTYQEIADRLGKGGAARAVGAAVAKNPVGYLIPCHRVIRVDGRIGEFRWGSTRKAVMIGIETLRASCGVQ